MFHMNMHNESDTELLLKVPQTLSQIYLTIPNLDLILASLFLHEELKVRYQITKEDFLSLLQYLLDESIVDTVLSGKEKKNRYTISPDFVSDPKDIENLPLSQLLVYGYAKNNSAANELLHSKKALTEKVAVIGRACDVRAMVELEKKIQLKWENLFIISFHDMGYLPNKPLRTFYKKAEVKLEDIVHERLTQTQYIVSMKDGSQKEFPLDKKLNISNNCSRCVEKSHPLADFLLSTYGLASDSQDYIITPQSERAIDLISKLGWEKKELNETLENAYNSVADQVLQACTEKRTKDLQAFLDNENRIDLLAKCTACGMCVRSCPVCFCTTCNLQEQVRAGKLSKIGFVTTRFTHVGDICVECGKCSTNCPMNIPLDLFFQSMRDKFKKSRNYAAGTDRKKKVYHLDI